MAMSLADQTTPSPPTPASPPLAAAARAGSAAPASPIAANTSNIAAAANAAKRKPSRRANTAERRATHNAVERQRRETLNSRFLDLAALLPNLSQIRRPSKSSIVNSSIAHIHASRRHRLLASREVRVLKHEADSLRRELNEWRDRAGLPRVEEPMRSDAFAIVVNAEMDAMMVSAEMGAHHALAAHMEEDGDDQDDDWGMAPPSGPSYTDDELAYPIPPPQSYPSQQQHQQQSGYMPAPQYPPHHHMQAFVNDEGGRPSSKSAPNPFSHNLPRGSPVVPYGEGSAGALFTPPVSRDGPVSIQPGSSVGGSVSGGASPTHSVQSHHHYQQASPVDSRARSVSGSPVGFVPQSQRRDSSGSPSYELGYYSNGSNQQQHNGSLGGMMHGYGGHHQQHHHSAIHPGMGMGYHGHGPPQHSAPMVGVGAGAMGGVFGMML